MCLLAVALRLSPPPASLREAQVRLLRSGPRVRVGLWPTNTALPPARPHPRPPIPSLPIPPHPRPSSHTPSSTTRSTSVVQSPHVFKPPFQHSVKSPVVPVATASPSVAIPHCNFITNAILAIELTSQPGRKRGNQGNEGNWAREPTSSGQGTWDQGKMGEW